MRKPYFSKHHPIVFPAAARFSAISQNGRRASSPSSSRARASLCQAVGPQIGPVPSRLSLHSRCALGRRTGDNSFRDVLTASRCRFRDLVPARRLLSRCVSCSAKPGLFHAIGTSKLMRVFLTPADPKYWRRNTAIVAACVFLPEGRGVACRGMLAWSCVQVHLQGLKPDKLFFSTGWDAGLLA